MITEETAVASIEEYRASQEAMEKLRARHVGDALKEAAGDAFTSSQLTMLMGDLDLAKFVGPDGTVDKARVKNLVTGLSGGRPKSDRTVAQVVAARREKRSAGAR